MLTTVFATKLGMTQAWTKEGKRMAVTRCKVTPNVVVGTQNPQEKSVVLEIGYGTKKLKNMNKPLRSQLEKSGFSMGITQVKGVKVALDGETPAPKAGDSITIDQVLQIGDIVKVQGITKGRGFAGAVKRHGFAGGPETHGQSDRVRAVGSIGAGTTPGRVFKGKRMPGHYGVDTKTVTGLVILHIDPTTQEVWLSGPVPGHNQAVVRILKTGQTKQVELLNVQKSEAVVEAAPAEEAPVAEAQA
ncbi:MAG TPA: 50S ribosomal protein L3 [Vitreimonas sp.]|nr:50S ribosomal protein L3 [Vitreimonas sp.]